MAQEYPIDSLIRRCQRLLNEVPEHMAQEFVAVAQVGRIIVASSMKFLSTWLRNAHLPGEVPLFD